AILALRGSASIAGSGPEEAEWEPFAIQVEKAVQAGNPMAARAALPAFLEAFQKEPLLFVELASSGDPRQMLRARVAQSLLLQFVSQLPRLGLLRETFQLLQTARSMEQNLVPPGRRVTEFDRLFETSFQSVIEAMVDSAPTWNLDTLQMLATEQVSELPAKV